MAVSKNWQWFQFFFSAALFFFLHTANVSISKKLFYSTLLLHHTETAIFLGVHLSRSSVAIKYWCLKCNKTTNFFILSQSCPYFLLYFTQNIKFRDILKTVNYYDNDNHLRQFSVFETQFARNYSTYSVTVSHYQNCFMFLQKKRIWDFF